MRLLNILKAFKHNLKNEVTMLKRSEKAKEFFKTGLNCSASVVSAFSDVLGLSEAQAARLSCGLGGGVGRQREVCGAVCGAATVLGFVFGGEDGRNKLSAYEKIQEFSKEFKDRNKFIVCRELLGLDPNGKIVPKPEERTNEYYKKRPCADLVFDAAEILEKMLFENGENNA